ncbi:MAG TPA: hypothetical protein VGF19_06690 [Candidatus Acidoferrum sp.]
MAVPRQTALLLVPLALLVAGAMSSPAALADEIRLKDGKKLYGVIVSYEDNMFKVKTDFGYVLVEKDKIASIIPDTPAGTASSKSGNAPPPAKSKPEPASARSTPAKSDSDPSSASTNTGVPASAPASPSKREKAAAIVSNAKARPEIPVTSSSGTASDSVAPALKNTTAAAPKSTLAAADSAPPPPPKEEPPPNREEVLGNLYVNHTYGFRMFKAPSWQLIEAAGQTLPNAIVAMGTNNESTLLVISREKTKGTLENAAPAVEKRLHDVYENYRLISNRKTVVGGLPALEYRYRGTADEHDWSGTLVIVSRGADIFTVLGMTYADTDLIQIQENVIARAISSLDFSTKQ